MARGSRKLEKFLPAKISLYKPGGCFRLLRWLAWCYWGAIRFVIQRAYVRSATGNKFLGTRINTGDFAVLRYAADRCEMLSRDLESTALPVELRAHSCGTECKAETSAVLCTGVLPSASFSQTNPTACTEYRVRWLRCVRSTVSCFSSLRYRPGHNL